MQRAWRIAGAVFAVLFAVWAHQSWQLSLQDALGPGPGFFPFFLSLIGVALAVVLIVRAPPTVEDGSGEALPLLPAGDALRKISFTFLALVVVTALLDVVGYPIAMAAFCVFLLYVLGARNWWVIVTFSLAASFGVEALFADLLKVPLPVGLIEF
jgi:putative tricarboxylic transport membrane protein